MPVDKVRRGRPKGSGLDDRAQLGAVARLLQANPGLKPTTAIRSIGISDPSSIRRLRDKLRTPRAEPVIPATGGQGDLVLVAGSSLATELPSRDQFLRLAAWLSLGLRALSTAVEGQLAAMECNLYAPHEATPLRQQGVFNAYAWALCSPSPNVRKTLH